MLELFARLNAKTAQFAPTGIAPLLEVTDLCGVLASLEDRHSWYVYTLINQQSKYHQDLLRTFCQQIILQEMVERKFRPRLMKPSEFSHGIASAVLHAHFHAKGKCRACNGLGFKASIQCEKCFGRGAGEYNWSDKVELAFPTRKNLTRKWYQQYCAHYDQLVTGLLWQLNADLTDALARIKRQARIFRQQESLLDDD